MDNLVRDEHAEPNWMVWDCETWKWADDVGGWSHVYNNPKGPGILGISCIAIWDSVSGETDIFDEHDLEEVVLRLESADLVVDFNGARFDKPLLESVTHRPITFEDHFDLLQEVWRHTNRSEGGNSLDNIAKHTLGRGKTADGRRATEFAESSHFGRLHRYCMNDVRLTRDLTEFAAEHGFVINGNGQEIEIEVPDCLLQT